MNKIFKYSIGTVLFISLILNLAALITLSSYSVKFNDIENRITFLTNSINNMNNKAYNTSQPTKEQIQNYIMTPTELADYMKIDVQQIYKSIIDNPNSKFPRIKINGEIRFSKAVIDEYILKQGNVIE